MALVTSFAVSIWLASLNSNRSSSINVKFEIVWRRLLSSEGFTAASPFTAPGNVLPRKIDHKNRLSTTTSMLMAFIEAYVVLASLILLIQNRTKAVVAVLNT